MLSVSLPLFKAFVEIVKSIAYIGLTYEKIIAIIIIVNPCGHSLHHREHMQDSEEQNNEYYDRLISEINEGLSFEGDEDVKTVLEDIFTWKIRPLSANISASDGRQQAVVRRQAQAITTRYADNPRKRRYI